MFAMYCPRHAGLVLLDVRAITSITNLAEGVIAVELRCYDGEHLVLMTGSRVIAASEDRRAADRRFALVVTRRDAVDGLDRPSADACPPQRSPTTRLHRTLAIARALHREVPGLGRATSVRMAVRAHRGHRTVALVGPQRYLAKVQAGLCRCHALVATVEPHREAT
jgi:hypothetical protein